MLSQSAASPGSLSSSPVPGMSVMMLMETWASAADAAAAAGAEDPGHARLTSGTVCVYVSFCVCTTVFFVLFVHLFNMGGVAHPEVLEMHVQKIMEKAEGGFLCFITLLRGCCLHDCDQNWVCMCLCGGKEHCILHPLSDLYCICFM